MWEEREYTEHQCHGDRGGGTTCGGKGIILMASISRGHIAYYRTALHNVVDHVMAWHCVHHSLLCEYKWGSQIFSRPMLCLKIPDESQTGSICMTIHAMHPKSGSKYYHAISPSARLLNERAQYTASIHLFGFRRGFTPSACCLGFFCSLFRLKWSARELCRGSAQVGGMRRRKCGPVDLWTCGRAGHFQAHVWINVVTTVGLILEDGRLEIWWTYCNSKRVSCDTPGLATIHHKAGWNCASGEGRK